MVKFLCLHGAFGSAKNFQVQLGPFIDEIQRTTQSSAFKWINGAHEAVPPPGYETYFGAPPLHRFIDFDGIQGLEDITEKIRDMQQGLSSEDAMRKLMGDQAMYSSQSVHDTMDRLFKIIEEDPEIDGILGYSEGATTAATLILEERRRFEEEGIPRRIKCGVFFAGWPPLKVGKDTVECILADDSELYIDVPTCHIVGCNDPYIQGAMALYGMCDEDTAVLFDHGKGHTVPRDSTTIKELALAVDRSVTHTMAQAA